MSHSAVIKANTLGAVVSKTRAFLSSQIDRRVSMMAEFATLEVALGKRSTVVGHQEVRVESATGGRMPILAC
jgi:hypothetical protein